jgi:hypothetical protein
MSIYNVKIVTSIFIFKYGFEESLSHEDFINCRKDSNRLYNGAFLNQ